MTRVLVLPDSGMALLADVPVVAPGEFREDVLQEVENGGRLVCLTAYCPIGKDRVRLLAVLANDRAGDLGIIGADVGSEYEALTRDCTQAHLFEREIAERCGIAPKGHPWLKPVRFPSLPPTSGAGAASSLCGVMPFFGMSGEEVHEVAVGPVHAGIIEPGHFRFQCHGETVFHLEISLGYQHRGVERALTGGPDCRTMAHMETLAGDTTIGHAIAYSRLSETLAKCQAPARAQAIRGIACELERIANHIGDLGALAGDIGFLPTMSYCGRIRGDFLNMTAEICGNRFGRGLIRPGGVAFTLPEVMADALVLRLDSFVRDAESAVGLLWEEPSVLARFEETGTVSRETCEDIGLVGVAARACGADRDVRRDFPYGIYRFAQIPISTFATGDVFARAFVRWQEIRRSASFVREQLNAMPDGPIRREQGVLEPEAVVVKLVEGWRGEICHLAVTDAHSRFVHYKVVDPSFHNWFGLAMAMRDQQISDFPLCNKSFNLSYCGFDL